MSKTTLTITEARTLIIDTMVAVGLPARHASLVADHLVDCELRGYSFLGLPRLLSVVDRIRKTPEQPTPITVVKETPVSAVIDGGDNIGYVVCNQATDIAIDKAATSGIGLVSVSKSWYNGAMSYYLERIAETGFVGMIASSGSQKVAPHGGTQARFSTNPIGFSFPSAEHPVVVDIGTSAVMMGDVQLKKRLGQELDPGLAFDTTGNPTVNPDDAIAGAFAAWGGHKGSAIAMTVQLFGMLAGQPSNPGFLKDCGTFIMALDPDLVTAPGDDFNARVAEYANSIRDTQSLGDPVRVPFDRSRAERMRRVALDQIEVDTVIYNQLQAIAKK